MLTPWFKMLFHIGLLGLFLIVNCRLTEPKAPPKQAISRPEASFAAPYPQEDILSRELFLFDTPEKITSKELNDLACEKLSDEIASQLGLDVSSLKSKESFLSCQPEEHKKSLGLVSSSIWDTTRSAFRRWSKQVEISPGYVSPERVLNSRFKFKDDYNAFLLNWKKLETSDKDDTFKRFRSRKTKIDAEIKKIKSENRQLSSDLKKQVTEFQKELDLVNEKICFMKKGCIAYRNFGIVLAGASAFYMVAKTLETHSDVAAEKEKPCEESLRGAALATLAYSFASNASLPEDKKQTWTQVIGGGNLYNEETGFSNLFPKEDFLIEQIEEYNNLGGLKGGYAFLLMEPKEDRCHVAFKGSSDKKDLVADLKSRIEINCLTQENKMMGACAQGFLDQYKEIRNLKVGGYSSLTSRVSESCNQVYIYGHSMGGTLASFFAIEMTLDHPEKFARNFLSDMADDIGVESPLRVFTYGEPRGLEDKYAEKYHRDIAKHRWLNKGDPVVAIPPRGIEYKTLAGVSLIDSYGHWGRTWSLFSLADNFFSTSEERTYDASELIIQADAAFQVGGQVQKIHAIDTYVKRLKQVCGEEL